MSEAIIPTGGALGAEIQGIDLAQLLPADTVWCIRQALLEHCVIFFRNQAISETDRLYAAWNAVSDTRCDFYYIPARRQAMKRLRDLIGTEAYQMGELPPYVPEWRFAEAK